ncbi:succinyl-diaminopimelate desuccinylase [Helicobacter jaachi]|uniref:Succinyl-diaminopimelate desuccinylase n=1 Tax=Helicobacter jaachi TaxID=1677920 RepID=A0A4V6I2K9_9HELI|nr:succinyl-diaminopimelate desuccinylase [Helicobacter jaachi]TLD96572.1 succinyl-diaminopimelate desuccinylase [Helicobacter jaachi]
MPISLLQKLVKLESITPKECGIYEIIKAEFAHFAQNPLLDTLIIEQEKQGVKNLFYLIAPKNTAKSSLRHLCFAGHIDVVPPGQGWEYEPFCAMEHDGYIYGRGTQDMKGGVSAFVRAICRALDSIITESKSAKSRIIKSKAIKSQLDSKNIQSCLKGCMISILLTSDEEGEGTYGTRLMLEELKNQGLLPHFCIVAEPTSIAQSGDMLKIGRRGSINGTIVIEGKQGHVAYPEKCINPIELLGDRLGLLAGVELDSGDKYFAPSKLVVTDIRGGMEVVNITPQSLKIMFNVRNSPRSSADSIRAYIESVLAHLPFTLTLKTNSLPFITSSHSALVQLLTQTIAQHFHITTQLSTSGGTSDARFFAAHNIDVVELGVPNDRIHAINERVSIKDLCLLCDIFTQFLLDFTHSNLAH